MITDVNQLTDVALNWAVQKCLTEDYWKPYIKPSSDWAQGGPIVEREKITLEWTGEDWMGYIRHDEEFFGPTPLIAAMRAYVASKLGDSIDVPDHLLEVV